MSFLFSTGLAESLADLFSNLSIVVVFLILTGLMLIIIEMFRYSKRMFGILGAVLVFSGILLRSLSAPHPGVLFVLLFFAAAVLLVAHILKLNFQKRGWLYQSVRLAISEPEEGAAGEMYEFLIDCGGVALTDIDGQGKVVINDVTFVVRADGFIARGEKVRVEAVDGGAIFVTKEE